MVNVKKVTLYMCVIMMVIGLSNEYSYSQEKPSKQVMKNIIPQVVISEMAGEIKYNIFEITHSFFKKGSNGRDSYCVEITYDISYIDYPSYGLTLHSLDSPRSKNLKKATGYDVKFSFMKKGNWWYGKKGWDDNWDGKKGSDIEY